MNIKSILTLTVALLFGAASLQGQDLVGAVAPVRIGIALTAGANSNLNVSAQPGMLTSYGAQALSVDWTDKALAFGMEGSLIFFDSWKLDLGGSFSYWNNPPYAMVPGTMTDTYEAGEIPTYEAVDMQHKMNWQAYIASSYYFRIPLVPALRPYCGVRFQASYSSASLRVDDYQAMGASVAEGYAGSIGVLTGVDYYFGSHFFVGASVEPFRYTYSVVQYRPQEGLGNLGADTHFMGAFAAPQLKIGFVF